LIFCVVCNPVLDVIYKVDQLQSGSNITGVPSEYNPAGKGINIAKVVKALGEEVNVVGLIPENDILRFEKYFNSLKIHSNLYTIDGNVCVNTIIHETSTGDITHITSAGYQLSPRIQDEFQEFLEKYMQPGDIWALSGSLPQGFDANTYMKIIATCKDKNIKVMLDSMGLGFNMGVRAKPAMVKPNLEELEAFFGEPVEGVHHIALKGKRLLDMGIEYVFISLGADGMIAIHENDCLLCSVPSVDVVDTIGSGDALVAGFLVAQTRKFSFIESCRMGVACGVSNAMHAGPGIVENDQIWSIMEDVNIEAV
jgi:1-phosphofructokinase family hexose kinase